MNVVIWGVGKATEGRLCQKVLFNDYNVIAFVDNNPKTWEKRFHKLPVISPEELKNINYDAIIIGSSLYVNEITEQITNDLKVAKDKILFYEDLLQNLCGKLCNLYYDTKDEEIKSIIAYYHDKGFNIFGKYPKRSKKPYYVQRDSYNNMPYIIFEGKRMYYPKSHKFLKDNDKDVVYDILYEQEPNSPHLYIRDESFLSSLDKHAGGGGGVLVDAGVCEGNFALRYIDKVSKCYLIESDPKWMEALQYTFAEYKDKVVFCNKYLSRYDSSKTITLDSLVTEKIDFLKMDIEGAEIDALLGGKKVLQKSNAKCAICSYHRQNDEENIKFILSGLGYQTSTSKGYMFFIHDENIADSMDFRRGVVYAEKGNSSYTCI